MEIRINRDIEAKEFKENFFYHFNKRETFTIAVALICGAAAFLIGRFTGLNTNVTTLMMVAFALPALLVGFFKKQGLGFIDYARKYYLVRKYKDMVWVSTEDPGIEEVCGCRRVIPTHKEDADNKTGTGK